MQSVAKICLDFDTRSIIHQTRSYLYFINTINTLENTMLHFESTPKEGHSGQNVVYIITFETYSQDICGKFGL